MYLPTVLNLLEYVVFNLYLVRNVVSGLMINVLIVHFLCFVLTLESYFEDLPYPPPHVFSIDEWEKCVERNVNLLMFA